jgi:hypothetical protein
MEFKIDTKVPMPTAGRAGKWRDILREMKKGHSILLNKGNERNAVWAAAKNMGIKIITRTEGDQIRVWRASA